MSFQPAPVLTLIPRSCPFTSVSLGGALSRAGPQVVRPELISVPPPHLGQDMLELLNSGIGSDCTFVVDNEEMKVGA